MKLITKDANIISCIAVSLLICLFYSSAYSQECNDTIKISFSPSPACDGISVTFTVTIPASASSPHFKWEYNKAFAGTDKNTYINSTLVNGDVIACTLTAFDCKGIPFTSRDSVIISLSSSVKPSISISTNSSSVCKGSNVMFTATSQDGGSNPSYQWKINGVNAGTNSDTFFTSSLNNGDVVNCVLTADPSYSCAIPKTASSYGISMTVSDAIEPSVSISASANNICPGTQVTFDASVQNAGSSLFYQWKLNGANAGSDSASYTNNVWSGNDEVYCLVTDSTGCSSLPVSSEKIMMAINVLPEIIITPIDTIVAPGSQVKLNANISGNVSSYEWQPSQTLSDASSLSPVTQPLLSKTTYLLHVVTTDGCSESKGVTINILRDIKMPNAFTPNGDGNNDVFRIPANTNINLREFSIYDRWGKKVFSTRDAGQGWDGSVNGKKQDSGVYVYVINTSDKNGKVVYKGNFVLIR